jgi:hypothetical protein
MWERPKPGDIHLRTTAPSHTIRECKTGLGGLEMGFDGIRRGRYRPHIKTDPGDLLGEWSGTQTMSIHDDRTILYDQMYKRSKVQRRVKYELASKIDMLLVHNIETPCTVSGRSMPPSGGYILY